MYRGRTGHIVCSINDVGFPPSPTRALAHDELPGRRASGSSKFESFESGFLLLVKRF